MRKIIFLFFILLIIVCSVNAQKKDAEEFYTHYSYWEAIPKLKKVVERDNQNGEALYNLANAYRLNGKSVEAELWFAKAVVYNINPQCKLYYAQSLLSNSKYLKAKRWFEIYANTAASSEDATLAINFAEYCKELHENGMPPHLFGIKEVPFNTDKLDLSPSFYNENTVVFVSNRKYEGEKKDRWTGDNYLKLFSVNEQGEGQFDKPVRFFPDSKIPFHEGPLVFTKDFKKIYFTKNNVLKKRKYDKNNNTKLSIFSANNIDGKWEMPEYLSINNNEYSVCHPALSSDETFMIFASDMPGGYGGMDLYISKIIGNVWGVPENLGDVINTPGNEIFPTLDCSDNLFFASNMHVGFGSLDIFKAYYENNEWTDIENVGTPINGPADDFGLIIKCDYTGGYFTSNRKGEDNIYSFDQNIKIIIRKGKKNNKKVKKRNKKNNSPNICGKIINKLYRNPLEDVNVKMVSLCSGKEFEFVTEKDGYFTSEDIEKNCYYRIHASKKNFQDAYFDFSTLKSNFLNCKDTLIIPLVFINPFTDGTVNVTSSITTVINPTGSNPAVNNPTVNNPTGSNPAVNNPTGSNPTINNPLSPDMIIVDGMVIELYNIYFDLDKYYIRADATSDLNILLGLLTKYPNMKGTLAAHTDSRASHKYNVILSRNRAKSAVKYLTERGINKNRLKWKGYGETKLKNRCADGVECSEEEHQRNRRIEFQVTYFDGVINSKERN